MHDAIEIIPCKKCGAKNRIRLHSAAPRPVRGRCGKSLSCSTRPSALTNILWYSVLLVALAGVVSDPEPPNTAPVADAGADQAVERTSVAGAAVRLDDSILRDTVEGAKYIIKKISPFAVTVFISLLIIILIVEFILRLLR